MKQTSLDRIRALKVLPEPARAGSVLKHMDRSNPWWSWIWEEICDENIDLVITYAERAEEMSPGAVGTETLNRLRKLSSSWTRCWCGIDSTLTTFHCDMTTQVPKPLCYEVRWLHPQVRAESKEVLTKGKPGVWPKFWIWWEHWDRIEPAILADLEYVSITCPRASAAATVWDRNQPIRGLDTFRRADVRS